ncbi:MAG: spore coat protein CotJB [Oscillospiraceae bacterium]|nr:spore coat protein CotJB [Oscillospiraceae bacterium]
MAMKNSPMRRLDSMGRSELAQWIRQLQFTMRDLALYLDTHPDDPNAHRCYLDALAKWKQALEVYHDRFGIQFQEQLCEKTDWQAWSSTPWPWEKEDN